MFRSKDTYGRPKYSGRSKATVIDNRDPLKRGRIQVSHPLLGETVWIDYLKLPNQFDVPSIGDIVYVECDTGEYEFPIAWGNVTKGLDSAPDLPAAFRRNVPSNRGMYTPGGHLFEMDDGVSNPTKSPNDKDLTTENRGIRLTSKAGYKIHISEDPSSGKQQILLEAIDGSFIKIDVDNGSIDINSVGNYNMAAGGDTKEVSAGSHTIEAASTKIDAPSNEITGTLDVGGATSLQDTLDVTGDTSLQANLQVTGISQLGGAVPLLLATAQFVGIGNLGIPVISSIMSGQATKALGA